MNAKRGRLAQSTAPDATTDDLAATEEHIDPSMATARLAITICGDAA